MIRESEGGGNSSWLLKVFCKVVDVPLGVKKMLLGWVICLTINTLHMHFFHCIFKNGLICYQI